MNMRTKVVKIQHHDPEVINKKIQDMENEGWYLRGNPDFERYDGYYATYLTFEQPIINDSEVMSEAGIPVELPLDIKVPKLD